MGSGNRCIVCSRKVITAKQALGAEAVRAGQGRARSVEERGEEWMGAISCLLVRSPWAVPASS